MNSIKNKWSSIPITVKASLAYMICSIMQKCLSLITLPLFTRILTKEQYGQCTIYSSWVGILSIFITLNITAGSFSKAMVKFEDRRSAYIASAQGLVLVIACIFTAIYLPFREYFNSLFQLPTPIILLMIVELVCVTATSLWSGRKRFEYKYKSAIAVSLCTSFTSPFLALFLVMNSEEKGYARIVGFASVIVIVGAVMFFINLFNGKKLFNKEFWKYALSFNLPLIVYYLSQVVFNQSDRIMISHLTGQSDAAMYGVAYNLAMVLTFVMNAMNNSYVPWFYGKIKEGKQIENKKISLVIAAIMASLLLFIIWLAPEVVIIMAGKSYMEAVLVMAPVSMSLLWLFYSQLSINVEFYFEEKKYLVAASILSAVANIVLNYLLIPVVGFWVAGYTTLISYILFAVCNYFAMKSILKKRNIKEHGYNIKALLLLMAGFTAVGFVGVFLYDFMFVRIGILAAACLAVLIFRKKIIPVVKQVLTLKKNK